MLDLLAVVRCARHACADAGQNCCDVCAGVYCFKFFMWETGYWKTMDIAHDRAGYYLCWGCLNWVPAIYTSQARPHVTRKS